MSDQTKRQLITEVLAIMIAIILLPVEQWSRQQINQWNYQRE